MKKFKFLLLAIFLTTFAGAIVFLSLNTRHKEMVKSKFLYALHILDPNWTKQDYGNKITFTTPEFLVSNLFKSMEGPLVHEYFTLNDESDEIVYLTAFKTSAVDSKTTQPISNDFICHTNFEYLGNERFVEWNLMDRIGKQYPRITSIGNGSESIKLPEGYGYPIFKNEHLLISSQVLNHNLKDSIFSIKHQIELEYVPYKRGKIKPLQPKTIFMMFPFNPDNPYQGPTNEIPNACIPVETGIHTYYDENGNALSGHWIIPPGKSQYSYNATGQLAIKDSIRIHQITSHLHPFATKVVLMDSTSQTIIYKGDSKNFTNKIGLISVETFNSNDGIWLYQNHQYYLKLEIDNTTTTNQDMMASMAMFYYDPEIEKRIEEIMD